MFFFLIIRPTVQKLKCIKNILLIDAYDKEKQIILIWEAEAQNLKFFNLCQTVILVVK